MTKKDKWIREKLEYYSDNFGWLDIVLIFSLPYIILKRILKKLKK